MAPLIPDKLIHTLSTHTAPINALTFSSLGGTYILSGSSDRQIHLSRTEPASSTNTTTQPIQKYASHGYPVLDIAVSADNKTFASVGGDRSVFLWDVQNNEGTIRRFGSNTNAGHTSRINCVAFAGQDDSVLVSGSDDTSVRLWDVKSRDAKPIMVLEEAKDGVTCVIMPGNGYEVVSGSVDGRVRSYDIRLGKVVVDTFAGAVGSLEVSRDGKMMLVGCLDGKLRVMDREMGGLLKELSSEGQGQRYVNEKLRLKSCFALNESLVLSGSEADDKVRVWDLLSGKCIGMVLANEVDKVMSVVRWREGSVAEAKKGVWAAAGAEGTVRIYAGD